MLEVMFVEKRKTLIRTYQKMLDWEALGFKILSVTDQEQQAISYFGEYQHDLIFLDLELKRGDGFSLIRKLKTLHPGCMIIVLTQREDYHSIHDAFRLGVYEYLLKKDMRVALLAATLHEVRQYYEQSSFQNNWQKQLEHLLGQYRDHGEINQEELSAIFDHQAFALMDQAYRMIYLRMDNVRQINRKLKVYNQPEWIDEKDELMLYAARLKQREELQRQQESVVQICMKDTPYLLLFIKKHSGVILLPERDAPSLLELAGCLKDRIIQLCQSDFSFTISETIPDKHQFLSALSKVMKKHQDRFYVGDGCILTMEDMVSYQHVEKENIFFQRKILKALQKYDGDGCLEAARGMLRAMKLNHIYPEEVIQYILALFTKMEEFLVAKGLHDLAMQKEAVFESETYEFLAFEVDRIFKTLRDDLQTYTSKSQRKVERMLDYIDAHLGEKLDVEKIATHAGEELSSPYASKLIKQKTGMSMLQLILKKRMDQAGLLLLQTDWKIKQIAEQVGYNDQLYFNKAFHKYFGISPSAYRIKHM